MNRAEKSNFSEVIWMGLYNTQITQKQQQQQQLYLLVHLQFSYINEI